jgi:hypothetical protein
LCWKNSKAADNPSFQQPVKQAWLNSGLLPGGGFLHVDVHSATGQDPSPVIRFAFCDLWGVTLNQYIEELE